MPVSPIVRDGTGEATFGAALKIGGNFGLPGIAFDTTGHFIDTSAGIASDVAGDFDFLATGFSSHGSTPSLSLDGTFSGSRATTPP